MTVKPKLKAVQNADFEPRKDIRSERGQKVDSEAHRSRKHTASTNKVEASGGASPSCGRHSQLQESAED